MVTKAYRGLKHNSSINTLHCFFTFMKQNCAYKKRVKTMVTVGCRCLKHKHMIMFIPFSKLNFVHADLKQGLKCKLTTNFF